MDELSAGELAGRSGATAEQLRRLVELGILTPTSEGRYRRSDIQRIRVVEALAEAGFAPEQLAELIATGAYSLDWTSVIYPEPTARSATTLEQAVATTGLPEGLAGRLFDAWELPRPPPGEALRTDDEELLRRAVTSLASFGRDEAALLGAARQLGDSLRRLAESQVRLFPHPRGGAPARRGPCRPFLERRAQPGGGVDDGEPGALDAPALPPPLRALRDRCHGAAGRGGAGAGRAGPAPPGAAPGDRLSRPDRLHPAHR